MVLDICYQLMYFNHFGKLAYFLFWPEFFQGILQPVIIPDQWELTVWKNYISKEIPLQ